MTEQDTERRPSRWARRSKGKGLKKRNTQKAMREVVRLHEEGFSVPSIAGKVRLPRGLVERIVGDDPGGEGS